MANTFSPRGLRPLKRNDGAITNFAYSANNYQIPSAYATNIFFGDPVKLLATGVIALAAPGDQIRGIFQGCSYKVSSTTSGPSWVWSPSWIASTAYVTGSFSSNIIDDPNVEFEAQFNGSTIPAQTEIGATYDTAAGSGTAATGISTVAMDSSTNGTTGVWRYVRAGTRPDNDTTTANFWGVFAPAKHDFRSNTGI